MVEATETVAVEHDGETIDVPRTFERGDYAEWFGGVPDEVEARRIYDYDDVLRVDAVGPDGEVVEVGYWPDGGKMHTSAQGWVAEQHDYLDAEDLDDNDPGTTLWIDGGRSA